MTEWESGYNFGARDAQSYKEHYEQEVQRLRAVIADAANVAFDGLDSAIGDTADVLEDIVSMLDSALDNKGE